MDTVWLQFDAVMGAIEDVIKDNLCHTDIHNLTVRQIHVLNALFETDGIHASTLAHKVGIPATSFTPMLDILVNKKLVKRENDPHDRRAINVFLEPKANTLRGAIVQALAQAEEKFG